MATVHMATVAAQFRAVGVEQARAKVLGLDSATKRLGASARSTRDLIGRRIGLLEQGTRTEGTRSESLRKLEGVESTLTRLLERGNVTLDRRIALEQHLARVQRVRGAAAAEDAARLAAAGAVVPGVGASLTTRRSDLGGRISLLERGLRLESTRELSLRKLAGVENTLTQVANRRNLSLSQQIALEQELARVRSIRAGASTAAGGLLGGMGVGRLVGGIAAGVGIGMGFSGATRAIEGIREATDELEASQRKLVATSRLTGIGISQIRALATQAKEDFELSSGAAADWTQNIIKLTSRAEQTERGGEVLARWLDLAAAQGVDATMAMQALETTLIGQDEGLNRLGLANPSGIYQKWAAALGTTAGKMTEVQKWQAIINEVTEAGSRVQGEYARFLETNRGQSQKLANDSRDLGAAFGTAWQPVRGTILDAGSAFVPFLARHSDVVVAITASIITIGLATGAWKAWGFVVGTTVVKSAIAASKALLTLNLAAMNPVVLGIMAVAGAVGYLVWRMQKGKREADELRQSLVKLSDVELAQRQADASRELLEQRAILRQGGGAGATLAERMQRQNSQGSRWRAFQRAQELERELEVLAQEQSDRMTRPLEGPGGDDDPAGVRRAAAARASALTAAAQLELDVQRAKWAKARAIDEAAYGEGLRSLDTYFSNRRLEMERSAERELRALRIERGAVTSVEPEDDAGRIQQRTEIARIDGQISIRQIALEQERAELAAEELNTRRQLTEQRVQAETRILELTGRHREATQRGIDEEVRRYGILLGQLGIVGDERDRLVAAFREPLELRADFDEAQREAQGVLQDIAAVRQQVEQDVQRGILSQADGQRIILDAERARLGVLSTIADRMEQFAEALKDPELLAAVRALRGELGGLAIEITPNVRLAQTRDQLKQSIDEQFANIGPALGGILATALGTAFAEGTGRAGDVLLGALGGLFQQMGSALITYGMTMVKLLPALENPFLSGPAAIVAGGLLVALGGTLSGIAGGRGTSSRGSGVSITSDTGPVTIPIGTFGLGRSSRALDSLGRSSPALTTPFVPEAVQPVQPVVFNATFVGARDLRVQREFAQIAERAVRRGYRVGGGNG